MIVIHLGKKGRAEAICSFFLGFERQVRVHQSLQDAEQSDRAGAALTTDICLLLTGCPVGWKGSYSCGNH